MGRNCSPQDNSTTSQDTFSGDADHHYQPIKQFNKRKRHQNSESSRLKKCNRYRSRPYSPISSSSSSGSSSSLSSSSEASDSSSSEGHHKKHHRRCKRKHRWKVKGLSPRNKTMLAVSCCPHPPSTYCSRIANTVSFNKLLIPKDYYYS